MSIVGAMEPVETAAANQKFGAVAETEATATNIVAPTVIEELLIEEISIDGMCGVY